MSGNETPPTGIDDAQLPEDLRPGDDNPLAEGLEPGETVGDLLEDGNPAEESADEGDAEGAAEGAGGDLPGASEG